MSDIGGSLSEETKCELLLGFFDRSEMLRGEGDHWLRLAVGDKDKTYAWLDEALNRAITRLAEKQNAATRRRHLQQMHTPQVDYINSSRAMGTGTRNGQTPPEQEKATPRASWMPQRQEDPGRPLATLRQEKDTAVVKGAHPSVRVGARVTRELLSGPWGSPPKQNLHSPRS